MTVSQVEWILVIYYGKTAHRAIYGRLSDDAKYSKDYIQLSRRDRFLSDLESAFPALSQKIEAIKITYQWPTGSAAGTIFRKSADRPHLAWETNNAPLAWKMHPKASEMKEETILGDPKLKSSISADDEFAKLATSGFGQPYLIATKVVGEPDILHLRVQINNPGVGFEWANIGGAPKIIKELADETSASSALAWRYFPASEKSETLYFDQSKKSQPWTERPKLPIPAKIKIPAAGTSRPVARIIPQENYIDSDLISEVSDHSAEEITKFTQQFHDGNYRVDDFRSTAKTRGSAQRVFADAVKKNYGNCCAITGIKTREFLIASHIVPWSVDENIRLDPSNGICLSLLVDRAFENGFLIIEDDLTVCINWPRVAGDANLQEQLGPYDGLKLTQPTAHPPKKDYLRRRRELKLND